MISRIIYDFLEIVFIAICKRTGYNKNKKENVCSILTLSLSLLFYKIKFRKVDARCQKDDF